MLVGVPRPDLCEPLARVLQALGVRRAMVVCGSLQDEAGVTRYLDEISPLGPTVIAEFFQERGMNSSTLGTRGFSTAASFALESRGGDRLHNASIIRQILSGEERGPKRDAVLLNAAAALFVAGRAVNLIDGWETRGRSDR